MINPKPGYAFIELDPIFNESEGGIIIASGELGQMNRRRKRLSGTVKKISLYPEGHKYKIMTFDRRGYERAMMKDAFKWNPIYKDIEGKRVLVEGGVGQMFEWNKESFFVIRLEHIVAIVASGLDVTSIDEDTPRCPRCKAGKRGAGNLIMTLRKGRWVCPRCKKTAEGEHVDSLPLPSSRRLDELQDPEKRLSRGAIISYAGQGRRSK